MKAVIGAGTLAAAGIMAAFAAADAGPDASVPETLGAWVEPAREAARREAGVVRLLDARLVDAACSSDGRIAVLRFVSSVGSWPSVATIGFPEPARGSTVDGVVTIVGSPPSSVAELSADACTSLPWGSRG